MASIDISNASTVTVPTAVDEVALLLLDVLLELELLALPAAEAAVYFTTKLQGTCETY